MHGSVRVKFESMKAVVQLGFAETGRKQRATRVQIPTGFARCDSSLGRRDSWGGLGRVTRVHMGS